MVQRNRVVQFGLYGMLFGVMIGSALWMLTNNAFYIFLAWLLGLLIGLVGGIVTRGAD